MRHLIPLIAIAAIPIHQRCIAAEGDPDGERAGILYAFVDALPDESDLSVSNDLAEGDVDGAEWDDHWRAGVGFGYQALLSEVGGPMLTYGLELGYNRYRTEDDGGEFEGEALIASPYIGIGFHAFEWLFVEGGAFAGIGASRFNYQIGTLDVDEDSDVALATEYGLRVAATFALGETLLLGARAGWIAQQLEGEFDGDDPFGDTTVESDTDGIFYGLLAGLRF